MQIWHYRASISQICYSNQVSLRYLSIKWITGSNFKVHCMAKCLDMLLENLGIQRLNYIAHKFHMGKNAVYLCIIAFQYFNFLLLFSNRFTQASPLQDDLAPSRVKHGPLLLILNSAMLYVFKNRVLKDMTQAEAVMFFIVWLGFSCFFVL